MPENQKCSRKASPPPVVMHREATDKATRLPAFLEMTRGPGGGRKAGPKGLLRGEDDRVVPPVF